MATEEEILRQAFNVYTPDTSGPSDPGAQSGQGSTEQLARQFLSGATLNLTGVASRPPTTLGEQVARAAGEGAMFAIPFVGAGGALLRAGLGGAGPIRTAVEGFFTNPLKNYPVMGAGTEVISSSIGLGTEELVRQLLPSEQDDSMLDEAGKESLAVLAGVIGGSPLSLIRSAATVSPMARVFKAVKRRATPPTRGVQEAGALHDVLKYMREHELDPQALAAQMDFGETAYTEATKRFLREAGQDPDVIARDFPPGDPRTPANLKRHLSSIGVSTENFPRRITGESYGIRPAQPTESVELEALEQGSLGGDQQRMLDDTLARREGIGRAERDIRELGGEGDPDVYQEGVDAWMGAAIQKLSDDLVAARQKLPNLAPQSEKRGATSKRAYGILDEVRMKWENTETKAWTALNKDEVLDANAIINTWIRLKDNPDAQIPPELANRLERLATKIDAEDEVITLGDIQAFRSKALEISRLSPNPKMRWITGELQEAALKDLEKSSQTEQFNAARTLTKLVNDTFYRGPAGKIFGYNKAPETPQVAIEKMLNIGGGTPVQVEENFKAMREIAKESDQLAQFDEAISGYLVDMLAIKHADSVRRGVDRKEWLKSINKMGPVLNHLPDLKDELMHAWRVQTRFDNRLGALNRAKKILDNLHAATIVKNPRVIDTFFEGEVPTPTRGRLATRPDTWVKKLMGNTKTDAQRDGLRRLFFDRLLDKVGTNKEGTPGINGGAIIEILKRPHMRKAFVELLGSEEKVAHLERAATALSWHSRKSPAPYTLSPPNGLFVTTAQILAARVAGLAASESTGGSLQTAQIAAGKAKNLVNKFTRKHYDNYVYELMHDPQLFKESIELAKDPGRLENYIKHVVDIAASNPHIKKGKLKGAFDRTVELAVGPKMYAYLYAMVASEFISELEARTIPPNPPPPEAN
jgi:hypothetical protein